MNFRVHWATPVSRLCWNYSSEDFMMKIRGLAAGCRTMPRFKVLERCMCKYLRGYELGINVDAPVCR